MAFRHPDHPRPVTRRQLLAQGFQSGAALLTVPSLFGFLARRALADQVQTLPFLVFDLAGGASLPGNFLVGKADDPSASMLASYDRLGWDPRASDALDASLGLPMAKQASQLRQGLLATASAAARQNLRLGSLCHFGQDDSSQNQLSALALVTKSGMNAAALSQALGLLHTPSGGNSDVALGDSTLTPLALTSVDDVVNAVGFGTSFNDVSAAAVSSMASAQMGLSGQQYAALKALGGGDMLAQLASAAYSTNLASVANQINLDPRKDALCQAIYQLTPAADPTSDQALQAAVAMNVIRGNTGPGAITIGGCDYHDGTQTSGDAKDLEIGKAIGSAVELAHQLGRPLVFQVLTDGGLYARQGTRLWQGDDGIKSMTVVGIYDPAGVPAQGRIQAGAFTDGQGADRDTTIGSVPARVAIAVLANYLNVLGRLGELETLAPGGLPSGTVDDLILFHQRA